MWRAWAGSIPYSPGTWFLSVSRGVTCGQRCTISSLGEENPLTATQLLSRFVQLWLSQYHSCILCSYTDYAWYELFKNLKGQERQVMGASTYVSQSDALGGKSEGDHGSVSINFAVAVPSTLHNGHPSYNISLRRGWWVESGGGVMLQALKGMDQPCNWHCIVKVAPPYWLVLILPGAVWNIDFETWYFSMCRGLHRDLLLIWIPF